METADEISALKRKYFPETLAIEIQYDAVLSTSASY